MPNLMVAIDGIRSLSDLALKPRFRKVGWPLRNGGNVWYVNLHWLNVHVVIDNEQ